MASSRGKGSVKLIVDVANPNSSGDQKSDFIFVYMTIDNSGSMHGAKLAQVISSIQKIIDSSPKHDRFIIRSFSDTVNTLVSKQKCRLDVDRVKKDLTRGIGGRTCLYDAWGQTIREISYENRRTGKIYILIFTDGEDNASRQDNLESVISLVNTTMRSNIFFTFIQAGPQQHVVQALRQCPHKNCQVLPVEDSAKGIQIAFNKVQDQMRFHFQIQLSSNSSSQDLIKGLNGLKITAGTPSGGQLEIKHASAIPDYRRNTNSKQSTNPASLPLPIHLAMQSHTSSSAGTGLGSPFRGQKLEQQQQSSLEEGHISKTNGWASSRNGAVFPGQGGSRNFVIRIHNIPLDLRPIDISNIFSQWGLCKLVDKGFEKAVQWVDLSYPTEIELNDAILHGDKLKVHGSYLDVNVRRNIGTSTV